MEFIDSALSEILVTQAAYVAAVYQIVNAVLWIVKKVNEPKEGEPVLPGMQIRYLSAGVGIILAALGVIFEIGIFADMGIPDALSFVVLNFLGANGAKGWYKGITKK